MPKAKKKLTLNQAVRKLDAIFESHLAKYSGKEREAKLKAFERTIARLSADARAKRSKRRETPASHPSTRLRATPR